MKRFLSAVLCAAMLCAFVPFCATAREPDPPLKYATVVYDIEGETETQTVLADQQIRLSSELAMRQYGDRILVGWKAEDGTAYYYDNTELWWPDGQTDRTLSEGEVCTFTPIWCPIALRSDEVFSFTNSDRYFSVDVEDGIVLTRRDFLRILPNWIATFALSPLCAIAMPLCAFFLIVWSAQRFHGACCGFAVAALLQHYGRIDLLSEQGVSSVSELQPDESMQSTLNYYNMHAAAAIPTDHVALSNETPGYSEQLRRLYETLEGGTPVYLEQYGDSPHPLRTILSIFFKHLRKDFDGNGLLHGVVLTGAYTDGNGNHILIMYDNNSTKYVHGTCDIAYINADFTAIYSSYGRYEDDLLESFSWNETFDQFDSFKTSGISDPFAWHKQFLRNLPDLVREIVWLIRNR